MNVIKNILGKPKFKGKSDWDFDGIKDSKDCQPFNPLRQDESILSQKVIVRVPNINRTSFEIDSKKHNLYFDYEGADFILKMENRVDLKTLNNLLIKYRAYVINEF